MKSWPYPRWIAHRGAGKLAPENTLAAFRLGEEYGYRMFECDVRLSLDGELFLLHDATLDRTTSGSGPAAVHQWSALSRLDAGVWHSPHYAGEPICHLDSLARFILSKGLALNIEMKPNPGQAKETGHAVTQVVRRLWSGQAAPWPLLSSFQIDALAAAQASAPELPRALLLQQLESGWLECARDLGCVAVVMHHSIVSQEQIQRLHEVGMRALSYTVNDEAIATTLWSMGMDGLITDAVDRFLPFESEDAAQQDAVVPSDAGPKGPASTVP